MTDRRYSDEEISAIFAKAVEGSLLMGASMVAYSALPLPNWARLRGRQMDAITSGLALSRGEPAPDPQP